MTARDLKILLLQPGLPCVALLAALLAWPLSAQYPGQVTKTSKDAPVLRAIAVLEWTGEAGKPTASRLAPVAVFQGDQLQDGGIYLARPVPLALAGEVEYELQQNGKPVGLFDIKNSGQEQGAWVGYGAWKPLPAPAPKEEAARSAIIKEDSDRPILHGKKHGDEGAAGDDKTGEDKTGAGKTGAGDSTAGAPPTDPDRPVMKKSRKKPLEDVGHVDSLSGAADPDRPRLKRGKSNGDALDVLPSLMGLPPEMQQAVAVSDAQSHPEHPWSYAWADPEDEARMKSALEEIARAALGLHPPLPTPAATKAARKSLRPAPPVAPPPLFDEQFRVFELAYGSGATLVLTARTDAPPAQRKFVALIAQPDLYGNLLVLLKNVADGSHLDETSRMRLVDAVDAMADNRGELLFELRGATQRQFALYRVLRGQAEKLFAGGGGAFGAESHP